jgi:cytochrome c oxidase assembly protein subunit 15
MKKLSRFAWTVLVYNLGVIAWGAYVRATRSGAGCGAHWPLCNGELIPRSPSVERLVEFSHRVTSGLALVLVAVLLVWVWRRCRPGEPARRGAAWAMVFMLAEAGVGAGLVLFRLVADNASMARALFMSVHLTNTLLLLASLALTAWWLTGRRAVQVRGQAAAWRFVLGAVALLGAGISGAVAALGDTLYPAGSLAQALGADVSAASHLLVRLRLLHPAITVIVALALGFAGVHYAVDGRGVGRRLGVVVAAMAGGQVAVGLLNVLLLAPVWMQIVHLMAADALWIAYVLLGAAVMGDAALSTASQSSPA